MFKKVVFCGILAVLAMGTLSLAACDRRPGLVTGTVTETPSGKPVANAEVVVYELKKFEGVTNMNVYQKGSVLQKQVTDENGAFSFSLAPAQYVIQVLVQGQKAADRMVKVQSGRTTTVEFEVGVPSP
jgi:VCBS repeat-containing protein